jgi:hypothetical protein
VGKCPKPKVEVDSAYSFFVTLIESKPRLRFFFDYVIGKTIESENKEDKKKIRVVLKSPKPKNTIYPIVLQG